MPKLTLAEKFDEEISKTISRMYGTACYEDEDTNEHFIEFEDGSAIICPKHGGTMDAGEWSIVRKNHNLINCSDD